MSTSFLNPPISLVAVPSVQQAAAAPAVPNPLLHALLPISSTDRPPRWPDARLGPVVTCLAGVGAKAGETILGAFIVAAPGAAIVFGVHASNHGELWIEWSVDGSGGAMTDEAAYFQVPAGERGIVCLTGAVSGYRYRPVFRAAHATQAIWVQAQNWVAP